MVILKSPPAAQTEWLPCGAHLQDGFFLQETHENGASPVNTHQQLKNQDTDNAKGLLTLITLFKGIHVGLEIDSMSAFTNEIPVFLLVVHRIM